MTIPDDPLRRVVEVFAGWSWPVTAEVATARIESELGWRRWARNRFRTGLPVAPDRASLTLYPEGEVAWVEVEVTDFSEATDDRRDASQKAAFHHYCERLGQWLGADGAPLPFPRDHDAAGWALESGARLELRVGLATGRLLVVSPAKVRVDADSRPAQ